ncbi:putative F-box/LRR-repeat protein 23 [Heracleum sosnowskyi]|uniref:F-box/LRR-repeat protein 23 n=1 Tax=Heracleum sosnowskyi TaxID=360622 RepID=A0AAD8IAP6_9APIA|nr:putative F-box/LRR-repeat protein 23 [Heracleum sosnowskyi]
MACVSNPLPQPAERSRNWLELPADLTSSILVRLGAVEVLMSARKVCKTWRQICSAPEMWRVIKIRHLDYEKSPKILKRVVTKAVDLSCGQLVDLDLQIWGHPYNLLRYVFDRSSQLRRLCLFSSTNITSEWLSEMLEGLPLLEELHLDCSFHFKKAIEIAAQHMTGLCHLEICGRNKMTSDGLLAIVENCPHLESLEVWHGAANVGPDLVRRLYQQIKDLKLSYDFMVYGDDFMWDSDEDILNEDDLCEQSDFYTDDETDDLDSSDVDDFSGLSDTRTGSDDYDDYGDNEDDDSDRDSD